MSFNELKRLISTMQPPVQGAGTSTPMPGIKNFNLGKSSGDELLAAVGFAGLLATAGLFLAPRLVPGMDHLVFFGWTVAVATLLKFCSEWPNPKPLTTASFTLWVALLLENLNYFPMWKTGLLVPLVATAWWIFNDLFRDGNGKVAWCTRFALGAFGAVGLHWLITGSLV